MKIALLVCVFILVKSETTPKDSYLEAYKTIHATPTTKAPIKREYIGYPAAQPPQYGLPEPQYGPPAPIYHYGPPSYGPPAPIYGPPAPIYGMPHAMLGILDKFKLKLNVFTLGKILLKLVIFKKIISLIAILCLLLFIPSLKEKHPPPANDEDSGEEEDVMMRGFDQKIGDEKLNNITSYILEAIKKFDKNYEKNCDSVFCRTQNVINKIDKQVSYKKLSKLYLNDMK